MLKVIFYGPKGIFEKGRFLVRRHRKSRQTASQNPVTVESPSPLVTPQLLEIVFPSRLAGLTLGLTKDEMRACDPKI